MKILQDKYPMGSFAGQKSPGRYIDGYLYSNLDVMANKISQDMTFLGIIFSSTLEVGTGKSVLTTQIGEAWTDLINKKYKSNIPFTSYNLVFRPEDLIERAFDTNKIPKHSCLILDEWEDATYWSKLGITLRQFFRKCRQLNLFMLCIIPNFFQMPMSYAVSRSAFAIDVKFGENFSRGHFNFYSFESKKKLYVLGKKFHNYHASAPDFSGSFTDGYGIPEAEYRKAKLEDMQKWDADETKTDFRLEFYKQIKPKILELFPNWRLKDIADVFKVSEKTICEWNNKLKRGSVSLFTVNPRSDYNNHHSQKDVNMEGEEVNDGDAIK